MRFLWTTCLSVATLFGSMCVAYFSLASYDQKDVDFYHQSKIEHKEKNSTLYTSQQYRQGVDKKIFFYQGEQRLQMSIEGDRAAIIVQRDANGIKMLEQLEGVSAAIQENVSEPTPHQEEGTQVVFSLQGRDAFYDYEDKLLSVGEVTFTRYTAPGHAIDSKQLFLLAEGEADRVKYQDNTFEIDRGKAELMGIGKVQADTIYLIPASNTELFDLIEMHGHIELSFNVGGSISCDRATIHSTPMGVSGVFFSGLENQITVHYLQDRLTVTADRALYDRHSSGTGVLTFEGDVKLVVEGKGEFYNPNKMRFFQEALADDEFALRGIQTEGTTTAIFHYPELNSTCRMTCVGPVEIDHQRQEVYLTSPINAEGKVDEASQVVFSNHAGKMYADRAMIDYSHDQETVSPSKIILQGNIKAIHHKEVEELPSPPMYILADRLEFFPQRMEFMFIAKPREKVLFLDQLNQFSVSADALKISRDQLTQKERVEGVGHVRFHLVDHEFNQLRTKFNLDK